MPIRRFGYVVTSDCQIHLFSHEEEHKTYVLQHNLDPKGGGRVVIQDGKVIGFYDRCAPSLDMTLSDDDFRKAVENTSPYKLHPNAKDFTESHTNKKQ